MFGWQEIIVRNCTVLEDGKGGETKIQQNDNKNKLPPSDVVHGMTIPGELKQGQTLTAVFFRPENTGDTLEWYVAWGNLSPLP